MRYDQEFVSIEAEKTLDQFKKEEDYVNDLDVY